MVAVVVYFIPSDGEVIAVVVGVEAWHKRRDERRRENRRSGLIEGLKYGALFLVRARR